MTEPVLEQDLPFLSWEFSGRDFKLTFATPDDVRSWLVREQEAWKWVTQLMRSGYAPASGVNKRQLRALEQMQSHLANLLGTPLDEPTITRTRSQLSELLNTQFVSARAVYSQTAEGKFVGMVAQKEPREAVHVLWELMTRGEGGADALATDYFAIRARLRVMLFDERISGIAEAEKNLLDGLAAQYGAEISNVQQTTATAEKHAENAQARWATFEQETQRQFTDASSQRAEEFRKAFDEANGRLQGVEESYRQKLALQSSVQYWEQRAKDCGKAARGYALAAMIFAALYFAAVTPGLYWLSTQFLFVKESGAPAWKVGIIALIVLLGLWQVRILVRSYLSNSHLAIDAKHRSVVVLTYLAMLRDEKDAVSVAERALVLSTVFRPASDGLIRDDGMPPTTAELASRMIEGRKPAS